MHDLVRSLLNSKAECGKPFTQEEAAHDMAFNCGHMTQEERADRWTWSQSKVSRKNTSLVHAAHKILSFTHNDAYLIGLNGSKNDEIEDSVHNCEYETITKEKEERKEEKVTQKEEKLEEKETPLFKRKIPLKGYKKKNISPQKPQIKRFKKPTLLEVEAYFTEYAIKKNLCINPAAEAEAWYDHKEGNGWKVGRTPMNDWQATVRTWCRSDFRNNSNGQTSNEEYQLNKIQRDFAL